MGFVATNEQVIQCRIQDRPTKVHIFYKKNLKYHIRYWNRIVQNGKSEWCFRSLFVQCNLATASQCYTKPNTNKQTNKTFNCLALYRMDNEIQNLMLAAKD